MNNEKFYNDAESKLRASGNHATPIKKIQQVKKSLKYFMEKLENEKNDKAGTN